MAQTTTHTRQTQSHSTFATFRLPSMWPSRNLNRDRKLAMLDFVQNSSTQFEFSLSYWWLWFVFAQKKNLVCLFVLVLSLQIRSKRFSAFGGFCFDKMHSNIVLFATLYDVRSSHVYTFWSIYSPKFACEEVKH